MRARVAGHATGAERQPAPVLWRTRQDHRHQQYQRRGQRHQLKSLAPADMRDQRRDQRRKQHATHTSSDQHQPDRSAAVADEPRRHHDHRDVDAARHQRRGKHQMDQVDVFQRAHVRVGQVTAREHQAAHSKQCAHAETIDGDADERCSEASAHQRDQIAQLEIAARPAELADQRLVERGNAGDDHAVGHHQHGQAGEGDQPGEPP